LLDIVLLMATAAMLFASIDNIIIKYAMPRLGEYRFTILILGIGILPLILAFLAGTQAVSNAYAIGLALVGGIFLALGYILYYESVQKEEITETTIMQQTQPAILLLFSIFVLAEPISALKGLAVILIFSGSFLVLIKKGFKINRKMLPALLGGASWAVYWIFITYSFNGSGYIEQLTIARSIAFVFVLIYAYAFNRLEKKKIPRKHTISMNMLFGLVLVMGIFDSMVNVTFGYVDYAHLLSLASSVAAIGPVLTAILARFIFKDRLTALHWIGFITVVIGAVLIGAG
jgi:drug/metabolite transporter (DMT)-like permease